MNYELAKELKEGGFPQGKYPRDMISPDNLIWSEDREDFDVDADTMCPTLSELIEACGEDFIELSKYPKMWDAKGGWEGDEDCMSPKYSIEAPTPEEAVAKLWLKLHKKV